MWNGGPPALLTLLLLGGCAITAKRAANANLQPLATTEAPGAVPEVAKPAAADPKQTASETRDLSRHFGTRPATFVGFDERRALWLRYDAARADEPLPPASTFKLPNALIALDLGVVSGPDFELRWDPEKARPEVWWRASWRRDHTLRTALKNSVFWYFQEVARRIGRDRMGDYVRKLHYGNQNIDGEIDSFWIRGALRISANQQVDFLRRLYREELDVSGKAMQTLKALIVLEESADGKLSGKTGTVPVGQGGQLSWLVGYVERRDGPVFFAWNFESTGEEFWNQDRRIALTRRVLAEWDVLPRP